MAKAKAKTQAPVVTIEQIEAAFSTFDTLQLIDIMQLALRHIDNRTKDD